MRSKRVLSDREFDGAVRLARKAVRPDYRPDGVALKDWAGKFPSTFLALVNSAYLVGLSDAGVLARGRLHPSCVNDLSDALDDWAWRLRRNPELFAERLPPPQGDARAALQQHSDGDER